MEPPQEPFDEGVGGTAIHSNSGESGENLSEQEQAELWLATEGARMLLRRGTLLYPERVKLELKRFRETAGDDVALVRIIVAADTSGRRDGGEFLDFVRQAILAHRRDATGQRSLPLTAIIRKGGRHG